MCQMSDGRAVSKVAGNHGYDSVKAFISMLKKALNQPPTHYVSKLR